VCSSDLIDVTACVHCGGTVRIVASIEEPALLQIVGGDKLIIPFC